MRKDRIELTVTVLVGIIASAVVLFVAIRHILPVAMPFLIGWLVALAVRAPAAKISGKLRISEKLCRVLTAVSISLLLFTVISVLLWQTVALIWNFLSEVGSGENPIYDVITSLASGRFIPFGDAIPDELAAKISDAIGELLSSVLTGVASAITTLASSVPSVLLFLLITLISIIYFALDLEKINTRVRSILPKSIENMICEAGKTFLGATGKYMGSYLIIMLITFGVMTVGLLMLRVRSALLLALILAVFDLLPVIGVGTVLIPWSIIAFATGDHYMGIGLILLFIVTTVIRELCEPKIVGRSLGIHPLISLVLIYAGYGLFGLYGLLVTPLIAAVIGLFIKKDDTAKIP